MNIMELQNRRSEERIVIEHGVRPFVTAVFVKVTTVRLIISGHTELADLGVYQPASYLVGQIVVGSLTVVKYW